MCFLSNFLKKEQERDGNIIEKNALNGDMKSIILLAQDSITGICALKSEYSNNETLKWNKLAAEHGDADSQYNYGLLLFKSLSFDNNTLNASEKKVLEESIYWFKKAAKQNYQGANKIVNDLESLLI